LDENNGSLFDFIGHSQAYGRTGIETDLEILTPEKAIVNFEHIQILVN
jgi:hypothetical protein